MADGTCLGLDIQMKKSCRALFDGVEHAFMRTNSFVRRAVDGYGVGVTLNLRHTLERLNTFGCEDMGLCACASTGVYANRCRLACEWGYMRTHCEWQITLTWGMCVCGR